MSFRLCFLFQFHTSGEIYLLAFLGYIYGPRLWIEQQPTSSQTFCTLSIVPAFSVGLRSCRIARGLLRRPSTDLHHCASAFITKRVQLGLLPSFRSRGLTLFSLWGHLQLRFAASFPATRGGRSAMTICWPPSIGPTRIWPTASPLQNRLWP